MSEPRAFSGPQRTAIYLAADGRCAMCKVELEPGWHADHIIPWSQGGATDVVNGQALCPPCNLKKGARMEQGPRKWQVNAMRDLLIWLRKLEREPHKLGFLVEATPGAGKTRFAIDVIREMMQTGRIQQVVVVVPTKRLETQWYEACAELGVKIDPQWHGSIGKLAGDVHGCAVTYGEIPRQSLSFRRLVATRPTLVILDEVHHLSDDETKAWGSAIKSAFGSATVKLLLSGTPFRSDDGSIPFVRYVDGVGAPDFRYGYGEALADKIVRAVFFPKRGGRMEWDDPKGKRREHTFEDEIGKQASRHRLRTAIQANGEWLPAVLAQADEQLAMLRATDPRAGGIVFCSDVAHARAVAAILSGMGRPAIVVVSEDDDSDIRVKGFSQSADPWIVTVRKVSEGVDIPRLRVGVYATPWTTEMFFRQVVGRVIRRPNDDEDPTAYLFIPDDPELRRHAAEIAETRDAVLREEDDGPADNSLGGGSSAPSLFMPISSSPAIDAGTTAPDGTEFTPDELQRAKDVQGDLPVPMATEIIASILRLGTKIPASDASPADPPESEGDWLAEKNRARIRNNVRVGQIVAAHGADYSETNSLLNRLVGVESIAQASLDQLKKRYELATEWHRSGKPPSGGGS